MATRDRPVLLPLGGPACREPLVHREIAARAAEYPDAPALLFTSRTVDYRELNAGANQLAHHLRARGVGPGTPVAVHLDRSPEHYKALLAVLRAGGGYLPLDPAYPAERLRYMAEDSAARFLITRSDLASTIDPTGRTVVVVDGDAAGIGAWPAEPPPDDVGPDDMAYVIYTSASTGKPKGAVVGHGGLANLCHWHRRAYGLTATDRGALLAPLSFDGSALELWPLLTAGASARVVPESVRTDMAVLVDELDEHRVTIAFLTTALGQALLDQPGLNRLALRYLLLGGEALRRRPPASLPFELVNIYGPTETSMYVTTAVVAPAGDEPGPIPIGWPVDGVRVSVLDEQLKPMPEGAAGELCVGGAAVGHGYLGRPDLTAERFVADPAEPAALMYRTGDRARRRADGALEFLGRLDRQTKLRGHRIELGEVESAMAAADFVAHAVADVRWPGETAQLVGYAVPNPRWAPARDPRRRRAEYWLERFAAVKADPALTASRLRGLAADTALVVGSTELAGRLGPNVDVLDPGDVIRRGPHALAGHLGRSYELVALDAVVGCLEDVEQLHGLLEHAVAITADGGHVAVSQVRSVRLLDAYHAWQETREAQDAMPPVELSARVAGRRAADLELAVDPVAFTALARKLPRVTAVDVVPRYATAASPRGGFDFDAVIRVGWRTAPPPPVRWRWWGRDGLDRGAVRSILLAAEPPVLAIADIPNAEVSLLVPTTSRTERTGDAVSPADLLALTAGTRYRLRLSWAAGRPGGALDAVWSRDDQPDVDGIDGPDGGSAATAPVNDPLRPARDAGFAEELRAFLIERVPTYLVPDLLVVLDELPLTPIGKVDRDRLPVPASGDNPRTALVTETERVVAGIVEEVLGLRPVGVDDNLMALGANSLTMTLMGSRINAAFDVVVRLRELLTSPRVRTIAAQVERAVVEDVLRTRDASSRDGRFHDR